MRWALVWGRNPHTGRETPQWRVRNVARWCRPNPVPGADGDKFRPATTDILIACKSERRYWDSAGTPQLDWFQMATAPYSGAHYATWPPDLCALLIPPMCPERVCMECGEPSRRIVTEERIGVRPVQAKGSGPGARPTTQQTGIYVDFTRRDTVGWTDCGHDRWRRGVVLDPFAGSGTTLAVATGLGRDAIGIDLDARNIDLARERVGMFLEVA